MDRTDPDVAADEMTTVSQFLDYHRDTLVMKVTGLDRDALAVTIPPSEMTLAGLVKHLALVEDWWFTVRMAGEPEPEPWASAPEEDPDWEWHSAVDDTLEELLAQYADSCARSRAVVARVGDLDARSVLANSRVPGQHFSMRWIILHMIEETARHNGHADLLREAIDGVAGE